MTASLLTFRRREYIAIETGIETDPSFEFGRRVFWLDYHYKDGTAFNVWDGHSYGEALLAARSWGLDVVDRTGFTATPSCSRVSPDLGGSAA